jgi:hypothetical protein
MTTCPQTFHLKSKHSNQFKSISIPTINRIAKKKNI